MKTLSAALIFVVVALAAAASSDVYCDKSWCEYSSFKTHIACNNNGKFHGTCKDNGLVTIDQKLQNTIVSELNKNRDKIAGGGESGYEKACRMATMQWDSELAKLAELNVKRCEFQHDCHNVNAYPISGQNIYRTTSVSKDYVSEFTNAIQGWYNEAGTCNMGYIKKYPENYSGKDIGHFTVMVSDRNNRVGCAASTYFDSKKYHAQVLQFTCNFAYNNMKNRPIYNDCARAGEKCTTGKHKDYRNLCSTSEKYTV